MRTPKTLGEIEQKALLLSFDRFAPFENREKFCRIFMDFENLKRRRTTTLDERRRNNIYILLLLLVVWITQRFEPN